MLHLKHYTPTQLTSVKTILVNRNIPASAIAMLTAHGFELYVWDAEHTMPIAEVNEVLTNCHAFLSTGAITITKDMLANKPKLKIVSQASAGYNNIAIDVATELGIMVANAPNTMSKATADIAFALMLAASRKMFYMYDKIKAGAWDTFKFVDYLGQELHGKTLGVYGLGSIGFEMAKLCSAAYNMPIIYHNRNRNSSAEALLGATYVSFEELLAQSDVLSVHCNLTPETAGVFNKDAFVKMKSSSIFVNVARGGVHVEEDLIDALHTNTIWGAGLDVTNPEPMDKNNPLLQMENVAITPHIGSATVKARTAMAEMAAQNIINYFAAKEVPSRINFR